MDDKKPKYINSPETIVYDKSSNLYGLNIAKKSIVDFFLLCEGNMDVISMHQAGFDSAIASLGTALTINQIKKMCKYKKKIILTYDSDGPGISAARRAIPMLINQGLDVRIMDLNPFKDPDEFIKILGRKEFAKRIESAEKAYPWLIKTILKSELPYSQRVSDIASLVEHEYAGGT